MEANRAHTGARERGGKMAQIVLQHVCKTYRVSKRKPGMLGALKGAFTREHVLYACRKSAICHDPLRIKLSDFRIIIPFCVQKSQIKKDGLLSVPRKSLPSPYDR